MSSTRIPQGHTHGSTPDSHVASDPPSAYDVAQTYQWNYDHGPRIADALLTRTPAAVPGTFELAGMRLNCPLGVAAGPLLNARWIDAYAKLGFDFLTYKTVRTHARPCYALPNWVFVETRELAERDTREGRVCEVTAAEALASGSDLSSAVSFGMPSQAPECWRADVRAARAALGDGQVLVVSVVGSPEDGWGPGELAADFALAARWAAEAGAHAVEANLSCPNVASAEGSIFADPELAVRITRACAEAIGDVPLLLKVGHLPDDANLTALLGAVNGLAAGVVTLNTVATRIERGDGAPAFGEASRRRSGVTGRAIFPAALDQVRRTVRIVARDGLSLSVIAVGGASTPDDVTAFLDAGASLVEMATAPVFWPDVAFRTRQVLADARRTPDPAHRQGRQGN